MKATDTNVLNFVGGLDKVFVIPPFQRNYEWGKTQCEELYNDIITSLKKNRGHYLGNVVYYVSDNTGASYSELILIDGQQRITTVLLLLCALRDVMGKRGIGDKNINIKYLINQNSEMKYRIRLKQTSFDSDDFNDVVNGNKLDEKKKSNIVQNYLLFVNLLENEDEDLECIYNAIIKLDIVDVNLQITDDLSTIQTVFEKINSTGKPLDSADLIRNYLLIANSSLEQEELYRNYWIKIEKDLNGANISRFAKDYLVLNICEDVMEADVYKQFKTYFDNEETPHKAILEDMLKYSKYYAWMVVNYPFTSAKVDEQIGRSLSYLRILKAGDIYPLCMLLFSEMYVDNKQELNKILQLITDYFLRYRIVSAYGGGGSMRATVQRIIELINENKIESSYDDIYFELSNSPNPASRFPNDDEFKEHLMESVNGQYARVLLLRIEESETKNIPIDVEKVTLEHLMPQTLSAAWISYLGGKDKSKEIHDKYLNCIGNLAPLSGTYNSSNSNKPWPDKIKNLKNTQFNITKEVGDPRYKEWKLDSIKERNKDIAERAIKAILSPLPRTRDYESSKPLDEFEAGIYPMSDLDTPMVGTRPNCIIYDGKEYAVSHWRDVLPTISKILNEYDGELYRNTAETNVLHKKTSRRALSGKDPIISKDSKLLVEGVKVSDSDYYVEGRLSEKQVRRFSKLLLEAFDLTDWFQISVGSGDD